MENYYRYCPLVLERSKVKKKASFLCPSENRRGSFNNVMTTVYKSHIHSKDTLIQFTKVPIHHWVMD